MCLLLAKAHARQRETRSLTVQGAPSCAVAAVRSFLNVRHGSVRHSCSLRRPGYWFAFAAAAAAASVPGEERLAASPPLDEALRCPLILYPSSARISTLTRPNLYTLKVRFLHHDSCSDDGCLPPPSPLGAAAVGMNVSADLVKLRG